LQVGFDLPAVTSDMITRFMGVDYGALPGHQATSPSKVGDEDRVVVGLGKEEGKGGMALLKGGKTDWEGEWLTRFWGTDRGKSCGKSWGKSWGQSSNDRPERRGRERMRT
jgi:hypothetical protein